MEEVKNTLEEILSKFSDKAHYEEILSAKEEYFSLAGKFTEEDEDFENRMNGFNYWYLFQRKNKDGQTIFETIIDTSTLDEDILSSLKNLNHSLFEYGGLSFTKKHIFRDILHDKKITIPRDKFNLSLVKSDIFIARSLEYKGDFIILDDISILPQEVRSILVKESKKVRKLMDKNRDLEFLMTVENLKTKWRRYGHLDPKKIFTFTNL